MDLEDKDGLTPLMHGLLAVRSSMDSESAVRAVSVLAQHSARKLAGTGGRGLGRKKSCLYCKIPGSPWPPFLMSVGFRTTIILVGVGVYHDAKGTTIFKMVATTSREMLLV